MGRLSKTKAHKVVADIFKYKFTIAGRPKAGKSGLFYRIVKEKFNGDMSKGLLLGFEKGYNALDGIYAEDVEDWEDFLELADELVDDKDELSYKVLCFDTVDLMEKMATAYVIKKRRVMDKKPYKALVDIPWGAGNAMLETEVSDVITRLDKAGYGLFFITHDKDKKFETKSGMSYDKTVLSLGSKVGAIIKNISDFIVFIDLDEKVEDGKVVEETREIYFRGNGALEAGSRFGEELELPEKIPYDSHNFIQVIEGAILLAYGGDEKALAKAKSSQIQLDEVEEEEKQAVADTEALLKSARDEITALITPLEPDVRKAWGVEVKKRFKIANYKKINDLDGLLKLIEDIKADVAENTTEEIMEEGA